MDFDDRIEDNPDDEILTELRRKQDELKSINHQNMLMTKRLIKLAREEMECQKLRKKLAALDAEVSTSPPLLHVLDYMLKVDIKPSVSSDVPFHRIIYKCKTILENAESSYVQSVQVKVEKIFVFLITNTIVNKGK